MVRRRGESRQALAAVLLSLLARPALAWTSGGDKIQGMCYGPFPAKKGVVAAAQLIDDFMSDAAKPLWGPRGRGDLSIIKGLGANTVRLYGLDPKQSHRPFLDEAQSLGIGVIPGLSDWPYLQVAGNCLTTNFNCYTQVYEAYSGILQSGWLVDGAYHPALRHVIAINEPDLKLRDAGDTVAPKKFVKGIISAIDAMLQAEKDAKVRGTLIPITATVSFALCPTCVKPADGVSRPALNQMLELYAAMMRPETYGYTPKNDLKAFYYSRFLNSFNTQNPAAEVPVKILNSYVVEFPDTPVAIEEFHSVSTVLNQESEMNMILSTIRSNPLFLGVSFFEYQVRYDKGGTEEAFGIFSLGDFAISQMEYFGVDYTVWCLTQVVNPLTQRGIPQEVQIAYKGSGVDFGSLCVADPAKVALTQDGFTQIQQLQSSTQTATLVGRVASHMGADVVDVRALQAWVSGSPPAGLDALVGSLQQQRPTWATWDPLAACVADRDSDSVSVGKMIQDTCKLSSFNCANIPASCKADPWLTADYVLSVYYNLVQGSPLAQCYFSGSAIYASSSYYKSYDTSCVVTKDPSTTPLTDEGYQAIITQKDPSKNAIFLKRVVRTQLGARITDDSQLQEFASNPPGSMYDVKSLLRGAQWVCGGSTSRQCSYWGGSTGSVGEIWWWRWGFALLGAIVVVAGICTVVYVRCRPHWRKMEDSCSRCCPKSWMVDEDSGLE